MSNASQAQWWADIQDHRYIEFSILYPAPGNGNVVLRSDIEKRKDWHESPSVALPTRPSEEVHDVDDDIHVSPNKSIIEARFWVSEFRDARKQHPTYCIRNFVLDRFSAGLQVGQSLNNTALRATFYARTEHDMDMRTLLWLSVFVADGADVWNPEDSLVRLALHVIPAINACFAGKLACGCFQSGNLMCICKCPCKSCTSTAMLEPTFEDLVQALYTSPPDVEVREVRLRSDSVIVGDVVGPENVTGDSLRRRTERGWRENGHKFTYPPTSSEAWSPWPEAWWTQRI